MSWFQILTPPGVTWKSDGVRWSRRYTAYRNAVARIDRQLSPRRAVAWINRTWWLDRCSSRHPDNCYGLAWSYSDDTHFLFSKWLSCGRSTCALPTVTHSIESGARVRPVANYWVVTPSNSLTEAIASLAASFSSSTCFRAIVMNLPSSPWLSSSAFAA